MFIYNELYLNLILFTAAKTVALSEEDEEMEDEESSNKNISDEVKCMSISGESSASTGTTSTMHGQQQDTPQKSRITPLNKTASSSDDSPSSSPKLSSSSSFE